jgi:hypothetical protein
LLVGDAHPTQPDRHRETSDKQSSMASRFFASNRYFQCQNQPASQPV